MKKTKPVSKQKNKYYSLSVECTIEERTLWPVTFHSCLEPPQLQKIYYQTQYLSPAKHICDLLGGGEAEGGRKCITELLTKALEKSIMKTNKIYAMV